MGPLPLNFVREPGGQALGLELAGFDHVGLVELDKRACETLRLNRKAWNVIEQDMRLFNAAAFRGVDLLAGGLPCPPFSVAGKQLGEDDERNLFPHAIRIVDEARPAAVMIENVRGFLDAIFEDYRKYITGTLKALGYTTGWRLLNASDFGVPQLRPRVAVADVTVLSEVLVKHPDPQVRHSLARSEVTPNTLLATLLRDADPAVAEMARLSSELRFR